MKYWVEDGGEIIRDFCLPFEARMLPMKIKKGSNGNFQMTEVSDRELWVMSSCFLVMKVFVGKLLFKPYKFRRFLGITKKDTDIVIFD